MAILKRFQLEFPAAPVPQGSYVPALRQGPLVYTAGQLPMIQGTLYGKGQVGHDVDISIAQQAARICFLNALAALTTLGIAPQSVKRVVRLGGFVACDASFTAQAQVMNGASDLAYELFGEAGRHVRASVGVIALPLGACVELDVIFECDERA